MTFSYKRLLFGTPLAQGKQSPALRQLYSYLQERVLVK